MPSYEDIVSKFKVASRPNNGNRIQVYCPAHDDRNASLSILLSDKKILLFCHAGCKVEDIVKAAGLTINDLFLDTKPASAIYQYRNADGSLSHEKLKYTTDKGKRFKQRRIDNEGNLVDNLDGINRVPYNYPQVLDAIKRNAVILYVEGEKDAETARLLGYVATTMGGASDWKDEWKGFFKHATIAQIPDNDNAGITNAQKVTKSLQTVCKSLKVVILPQGKDLTEWVELGNKNIQEIIDSSHELIQRHGISEPFMTITTSGYTFDWDGLNLKILIDHIKNEEEGEITVYDKDELIYISGIKLLSVSHKTSLARVLKGQRNLDWDRILNQVATKCLSHMRAGEPIIWLNSEYGQKRPEYLLYPLFVKNAANIIYADKSSAKSLFMTLIDITLTLPWHTNDIGLRINANDRHNVLFLDWENDAYITGWQKECLVKGLDINWCDLPYLHCSRPLCDCVDHIKSKITEVNADVIIIDSLGMAVGDDLNLTRPAFNFYAALRQLPVTPIIIAHTSKDIANKRKTVYGNAYYENEARCVWEVSKEQQPNSNELTITLYHRKSPPFSGYHESLAWKFIFDDDSTKVESSLPQSDKRTIDELPTENDVALDILYNAEKALTPKEILQRSDGKIKPTNMYMVLKRIMARTEFGIRKDINGKYVYEPNLTN